MGCQPVRPPAPSRSSGGRAGRRLALASEGGLSVDRRCRNGRDFKEVLALTIGEDRARSDFENLRVYQLSEELADEVWDIVILWDDFAKKTVGVQLVKAADSVVANIAEGSGRGSYKDNRHFVRIARGSLKESQHTGYPLYSS